MGYIDGMEEKLSQMMDEMKEMRLEVGKLHDKGIRARCSQLVDTVEGKVRQTKVMVSTAKENLISSAKQMVQTFREKRALRPVPCCPGPAYPLGSFPDGTWLCPCGKKHGAACREAGRHAGRIAPGGRPHQKTPGLPLRERNPKKARNYLRIRVCLPSCGALCCTAARHFLRWIVTRRSRWSESMEGAHP